MCWKNSCLVRQVVMQYQGHKQEVRLLLPLGDQLISADSGGDVIVWDVQGGGEIVSSTRSVTISPLLPIMPFCFSLSLSLCLPDVYLRLQFDPASFDVSAMMHPSTYLNKVLLGSSQGALQLWNIKTRLAC